MALGTHKNEGREVAMEKRSSRLYKRASGLVGKHTCAILNRSFLFVRLLQIREQIPTFKSKIIGK